MLFNTMLYEMLEAGDHHSSWLLDTVGTPQGVNLQLGPNPGLVVSHVEVRVKLSAGKPHSAQSTLLLGLRLLLTELAVLGGDEVVERRVLSLEVFNDGGDLPGDAVANFAEVFTGVF